MKSLVDFLRDKGSYRSELSSDLRLMHTANGEDFIAILASGWIKATRCTVFDGEDLVYFFLGRPAYKTPVAHDPSYWQLPAVFVFRDLSRYTPVRVYPFDSGAFADERFQEVIGRIPLTSFSCSSDPEDIDRLITTFFSSAHRYARGQPVSYETIARLVGNELRNFAPLALAKLYNFNSNREIDDRAKLLEFQYAEPVELVPDNLAGVICCQEWVRDPEVNSLLQSLNCKVAHYPLLPLSSASYYSKIYELAEDM